MGRHSLYSVEPAPRGTLFKTGGTVVALAGLCLLTAASQSPASDARPALAAQKGPNPATLGTPAPAASPAPESGTGDAMAQPAPAPAESGAVAATPVSSPPPGVPGIPAVALDAYRRAEAETARSNEKCHLSWAMVAGIGKVESDHARGGAVDDQGKTLKPILGPALNGSNGTAALPLSSGNWMQAEGPMQFLPSTWQIWGADGNNDGKADPNNIFDSALATGNYLCSAGDLANGANLKKAILTYNPSQDYLNQVSQWIKTYSNGAVPVPNSTGTAGDSGVSQLASAAPVKKGSGSSSSGSGSSGASSSSGSSGASSGGSSSSSGSGGSSSGGSSSGGGSSSPPSSGGGSSSPPSSGGSGPLPAPVQKPVNGVVGALP